ncbi:unnamed protein product [Thlaspi arvense]|uniref:Cytochrome P450 n=1 Tax=Thlaspi arvense TaxID=13288 RepID=A0AAU9TBA9_THLAR|nr:unnamed protein product [Thlaspi arvense]
MVFGRRKDERIDLKKVVEEAVELAGMFNIADFVPFLGPIDLQGITRRLKSTSQTLDKILQIIITEHEQEQDSGKSKDDRDFLDVLLSLKSIKHGEQSISIDQTNIKAMAVDMIVGAFDTSSVAIDWIMTELIRHPRVMKKLKEELKNVVGDDRMVEEEDLAQLNYLDMIIKETMRLHPVAPLLGPRESTEDIFLDQYFIPSKSRIIVNAWAIGRDPRVWSDNVHEFLPERFVGSDIDLKGQHFQLTPFGSGRRGCPGMQLGLTTVRLVAAQLVHCFDWELPDDMSPSDLDMSEKFGLSLPRAKPLLAIPTWRLIATDV